ncbi:hypothetical protein A3H38_04310 [candidate division WOR-1 bacterium RIFCSPLOWO2_02_FULL_46_20]|uniref:Membrane protein 6-pyruvoyl-tetrahydropterin synthase-related domain-containing protein n=1 Tax=candidate division WOR-1 bacterium RIFCSPLOWO2_02_FULL_46_20 TaxID=1802567 RepID=A0A1F4R4L3_UNCSA|nr:MAG: hypothetical protein A3H38_04310 [candidate division WOR-1 bacterium RIFCSPLOWO2_02_FULL_46_20]
MATALSRFNFSAIDKDVRQSLAWAIILPALLFMPYLASKNPQFLFFGDTANLYFPQFVEGYYMALNGALSGIDFLTNNGASAYFLRPNIPAFYPPYQIAYHLFQFETIGGLARAFVFILYLHSVLTVYFCMRLGRKYFQLDNPTSLLFAIFYFGAIARLSYFLPIFYFVAALFPLLLYSAFRSVEEKTWWRISLLTFPYVMIFLAGYLPLAINAVMLSLLFAASYLWSNRTETGKPFSQQLIRLFVPFGLASLVVFPIYLAMLLYNKLVPGLPGGVWQAAHEHAYQSRDIFALISPAFMSSRPDSEWPHVILGLISVLLLVLAFTQRNKLGLTTFASKIIGISLLIFSFYLLLAFGQATGLPDIFYFAAPGLGKMHYYGRYLLVASFFFFLAVAISFKHLVQIQADLPIGRWLTAICVAMIAVQGYIQFGIAQPVFQLSPQILVIDLLMFGMVLVSLSTKQSFYAYTAVISLSFFIQAANFNFPVNSFSSSIPPPYINTLSNSFDRQELLHKYFKQYSDKRLIKYADLSSSVEKLNGVGTNYPWMVQDSIKLSNYMGYELNTSVDRDYIGRFPYYGRVNFPWLLRTGAEFIIYEPASNTYSVEIRDWVDHAVPELDIGYGYKVAKLRDASGLLDYIPARNRGDFDNGIVRVSNANGSAVVTEFETDFVTHLNFQVSSPLPVSVRYELFPNKMMALYVDESRITPTLNDGLLEFTLPAGQHRVEYSYRNRLHQLFAIIYPVYFIFLFCILGWRSWLSLRSFHKFAKSNERLKI